jgi:peroxiredoxin
MIASIKVHDLDGNPVDLIQKYSGKPLLLIIYNNDCLGCTGRAIPLAYDFQKMHPSLQVIGIHSDFINREGSKENIKAIFTSGEIPFPIYIDKNHKVYDHFEAEGTPQWLLISAEGQLIKSIFGSQGGAQNRLMYAIDEVLSAQ